MSQTNPAHSASASALHIAKPPQGEHLVVQNTGNIRIECTFSAKEATLRQEGEDLIFTFSDGTSLTIAHYYATNAESSALPPLIMAGEAVQVPQLLSQEAAQQEAEQEAQTAREPGPQESPAAAEAAEAAQNTANTASKGKALPQNSGDAPSDSPTQQGQNAQNSSSTQASPSVLSSTSSQSATATATALDGGRFHNFDTNELLDGIHRLPGLDLPWGQKLHESKLDYSGLVEEDEIEADAGLLVDLADPADPVDPGESAPSVPEVVQTPPTLVVDAARLTAEEAGVRLQNSDPNADFAGTALITGKVQGTDAESTDLEYGFLHNGSLVQTLTTSYGSVTMAPDGSYSYSLNNDLPEINTMKEGQQAEDSFTVAVSDGQGGMDSQVITVEIHGTNDMPTLQLTDISFTAYGKQTVFSGQAVGGDGDTDASWTYGLAGGIENPLNAQEQYFDDTYGTLYIDTVTGVYRYELDHTNKNPLAEGAKHDFVAKVIVTDELGAHTEQALTVHLDGNGTYEPTPSISGATKEAGVEDGGNTVTPGTLTYTGKTDLSHTEFENGSPTFCFKGADGNPLPVGTELQGTYGTFTLQADGTYTYTLDNSRPATQKLSSGEKGETEHAIIMVTSENGTVMEVPFEVEVQGTNDAPTIIGTQTPLSVTEPSTDTHVTSETNTIKFSDDDSIETHYFSIAEKGGAINNATTMQGEYGKLTINASGQYFYELTSSPFQSGQEGKDTFTIVVKDAEGAYDTVEVTVNITGESSAPVIIENSDSYAHQLIEAGVSPTDGTKPVVGKSSITNRITVLDPDKGDVDGIIYKITDIGGKEIGCITNGVYSFTDTYGTLTIDAKGNYTYTLDNALPAVQALAHGETQSHTLYISVTDSTGKTDIQALTLTIKGSNDTPSIDITKFDHDLTQNESSVLGNVFGVDSDTGDTLTYSIMRGASAVQILKGLHGFLTVALDGSFTYTLTDESMKDLPAGAYKYDEFILFVKDSLGATAQQKVSFTITGTDDAPVISQNTCTIAEDNGNVTDTGSISSVSFTTAAKTFTAHDRDTGEKPTFALRNGIDVSGSETQKQVGTYGFILFDKNTGQYTYTLTADGNGSIQYLNEHDKITETFNVIVTSGGNEFIHPITVTITGTNDRPIFTTAQDLVINSDGEDHPIKSETANAKDIDDLDSELKFYMDKNFSQEHIGQYGTLTIDRDTGVYTYTLNQFDAEYLAITSGNTGTEKFTLHVYDGHTGGWGEKEITVTVHPHKPDTPGTGSNPPVRADALEVTEDAFNPNSIVATGQFWDIGTPNTEDDIKISSSQFYFYYAAGNVKTVADDYGSLTINNDGTYTYTLNNDKDIVQHLGVHDTITLTYDNISLNGTDTNAVITVTINGTNDKPIITVADGVIKETVGTDNTSTFTDSVTATCTVQDIDTNDAGYTKFYLVNAQGQRVAVGTDGTTKLTVEWGTVVMQADGTYTFTMSEEGKKQHWTEGEVHKVQVTVEVDDGSLTDSATDRGVVTIEIIGDNQHPVINAIPGLSVTEDMPAQDILTGKIDVTDDTDGLKFEITGYTDKDGKPVSASTDMAESVYGTLMLNSDGTYQYVFNSKHGNVQALGQGETMQEKFTITVTDKHEELAPGTHEIVVTITGTNDAPILVLDKVQLVVREDTILSDSCVATTKDVDINDKNDHKYSDNSLEVQDSFGHKLSDYGSFVIDQVTGTYTFQLNNDAVQSLTDNDQLQFTVKLTTTDGEKASDSQNITIVIKGTDDLAVTEGGAAVSDAVNGSDAGTGTFHYKLVIGNNTDGTYIFDDDNTIDTINGKLMLNGDTGEYTYTPNANITGLGEDQNISETYTFAIMDESNNVSLTQDVTVTITGADDPTPPPVPPITPITPPTPTSFSSPVETESLDALLPASLLGPEQGAAGSALAAEQGPGLDSELPAALEHASLADMQACLDAMPEVGLCSQGGGQGDAPEAYTPFIADDLPVDMPLSLSDKGEAQLAQEVAQRILAETGAI